MRIITDKKAKEIVDDIGDNLLFSIDMIDWSACNNVMEFMYTYDFLINNARKLARSVRGEKGIDQLVPFIYKCNEKLFADSDIEEGK